jgi:hypothetical protein
MRIVWELHQKFLSSSHLLVVQQMHMRLPGTVHSRSTNTITTVNLPLPSHQFPKLLDHSNLKIQQVVGQHIQIRVHLGLAIPRTLLVLSLPMTRAQWQLPCMLVSMLD